MSGKRGEGESDRPFWNDAVGQKLEEVNRRLWQRFSSSEDPDYGAAARKELERLQDEVRKEISVDPEAAIETLFSDDTMFRLVTKKPEFWVVSQKKEFDRSWSRITETYQDVGLVSSNAVLDEGGRQYLAQGYSMPRVDDVRYEKFENKPALKLPSWYQPDYFPNKGYHFVSPRLFRLLDQPAGTLQAIATETEWFGSNPPHFSYLWLSFIPRVPAIDIAGYDPADLDEVFDAATGTTVTQILWRRLMPLREDLASPFGMFRAAESGATLLASDAVAHAVLSAGHTGIQFDYVEINYLTTGPKYRRTLDGKEPLPD